jgi:hypothetical protein
MDDIGLLIIGMIPTLNLSFGDLGETDLCFFADDRELFPSLQKISLKGTGEEANENRNHEVFSERGIRIEYDDEMYDGMYPDP